MGWILGWFWEDLWKVLGAFVSLLWLAWAALVACAFRSIAAQVYGALVAHFSLLWLIFSIF